MKPIFCLCGFDVREEVLVSGGRKELVVKIPTIDYLSEFKIDDKGGVDAAGRQIENIIMKPSSAHRERKALASPLNF